MDERISRLTTPEECEQVALNVETRLPELAREARRRAVELRAAAHGAITDAEREALEAVYAYERVLSKTKGKNVRASRTWPITSEAASRCHLALIYLINQSSTLYLSQKASSLLSSCLNKTSGKVLVNYTR